MMISGDTERAPECWGGRGGSWERGTRKSFKSLDFAESDKLKPAEIEVGVEYREHLGNSEGLGMPGGNMMADMGKEAGDISEKLGDPCLRRTHFHRIVGILEGKLDGRDRDRGMRVKSSGNMGLENLKIPESQTIQVV